jgi:ubiquinone/menaquinone biosynthesis C-methylase UbiE
MRFHSLELMYDPITTGQMENLGISKGWSCLEVGGGGGSVSRWLSEKVGREGRVLVTDINPLFLTGLEGKLGNVKLMQHDITNAAGLPEASFNLAHARLVLIHLPQRMNALANMISALKPGGWVLIEDFDFITEDFPRDYHPRLGVPPTMSTEIFRKTDSARKILLTRHGADLYYSRNLHWIMRAAGLTEVGLSAQGMKPWPAGSPGAGLHIANTLQSRKEMIESGLLAEKEFESCIQLMEDPEWVSISPLMVSAWGRKPN